MLEGEADGTDFRETFSGWAVVVRGWCFPTLRKEQTARTLLAW